MRRALPVAVLDIITSDPAILLFSSIGLAATAISIIRDTRAQRQEQNLVAADDVQQLVADDLRSEAA